MSGINRDNYGKYFIDYLDGVLTQSEVNQLMDFLASNPSIKEEFDEFENTKIIVDKNINYKNKKSLLKKTSVFEVYNENNFNELCIARIEGDLTKTEKIEFNTLIEQNPMLKKDFALFEKTVLIPEMDLIFKSKSFLKKSSVIKKQREGYFQFLSIAASVITLIALAIFIPKQILNKQDNSIQNVALIPDNKEFILSEKENTSQLQIKEIVLKPNIVSKQIAISENNFEQNIEETIIEPRIDIQRLNSAPIKIAQNSFMPGMTMRFSTNVIQLNINTYKEHLSIRDFLVQKFNQKILKKDDNLNEIHSYDFALLAINGVNKLTGTKMSLEKKYNSNGDVDELEFNSRLLAFSTPIKK
ncbi:MAG: hypothetical protein A2W99_06575 [Bacteroidetes bacterium GWF2_33_16]|nr:MAG: hypothetical protein A2X00_05845 [Bacteroidetes bacterium GWE2_32_14]OFY04997.1 MAG: hypothetical protein A2W99_06575 [Bacteroidetes bacterium GWF2_33_16]